jgi:hypothetical protein
MSKIEAIGPKAADSSEWNRAWSAISQLAAARGATLRELGPGDRSGAVPAATPDAASHAETAADLAPPFPPVAPDQLARDMAEIERAAAALRRAEPTLERRVPNPSPSAQALASAEAPAARSVWPLLCVIWLTAAAVVSCAIGAITLLLG